MEDDNEKLHFFIEPSRIQDLTDGIFAFSMTLLIVSVAMPEITGRATEQMLLSKLSDMVPTFLTFFMSFFLIAIFWELHHRQFQSIKKSNSTLVWINILMMLFIVMIPFTTNLIDDYDYLKVANIAFNVNMLLIGIMFYIQYAYSADHKLLDERISTKHIAEYKKRNSIIAIVSLIALIVGIFLPRYSSFIYLSIPIILFYIRKNSQADKIARAAGRM